MIHRAAMVLLTAFLLVGGLCCHPMFAKYVPPDLRTNAEKVEAKSVAFISDGENKDHSYCGGVWVSGDRILTAFHCVEDLGEPPENDTIRQLLQSLGAEMPGADMEAFMPAVWDPKGQIAHYADKSCYATHCQYNAVVIYYDRALDLALLQASDPEPQHDTAAVATRPVHDGDEVDIVGSTAGMGFSYSHGWIQSSRHGDGHKLNFERLQIAGPVYFGNSGGGAFDEHGDLIGIADHMAARADGVVPGLGFFQAPSVLQQFLLGAPKLP